MKVSIIITVYNRTIWLRQALESVLHQSASELEVLLIDDGSTTSDAERIATSYPKVKYFWQPNQGLGSARNTGLARSSGDLILFLDDDDWLTPEAIAEKKDLLQKNSDIGIAYSDLYTVDGNDSIIGKYYEHRRNLPPSGDIYVDLLPRNFIPIHAMLWRRKAIIEAGGFPEWSGAEDWHLLIRAAKKSYFEYINKVHGAYRIHETNMTRIIGQQIRGYSKVQEEVLNSERFSLLPKHVQAKVLSHYAVLQMMSGDPALARAYLRRARKLAPRYSLPLLLSGCALLGRTTFQKILATFRFIRYRLRPIPSSTSIFLGYE